MLGLLASLITIVGFLYWCFQKVEEENWTQVYIPVNILQLGISLLLILSLVLLQLYISYRKEKRIKDNAILHLTGNPTGQELLQQTLIRVEVCSGPDMKSD